MKVFNMLAMAIAFSLIGIEPAFAGGAVAEESGVVNELAEKYKPRGKKKNRKAQRRALKKCFSSYYKSKPKALPPLHVAEVTPHSVAAPLPPLPHPPLPPGQFADRVKKLKTCLKKAVKG